MTSSGTQENIISRDIDVVTSCLQLLVKLLQLMEFGKGLHHLREVLSKSASVSIFLSPGLILVSGYASPNVIAG
jgi:hypothetical protein